MRVTTYSRAQIILHWLVVVLMTGQILLHEGMEHAWRALRRGTEPSGGDALSANIHVAFGFLIFLLAGARLYLRLTRGVPALPASDPGPLRTLAHVTHWGLYAIMLGMPVSGALAWFGQVSAAAQAHGAATSVLLLLLALHTGGALVQHFLFRSDVLRRMTGRV